MATSPGLSAPAITTDASQGAPSFIAVDWGTTSFRAYLATAAGDVIAAAQSARGILSVPDGRFEEVLLAALAPWRQAHGDLPVLMSGMIGSRQGWREAPYANCPVRSSELVHGLAHLAVPGLSRVAIVPGLAISGGDRIPDVMRGEETQVLGAMQRLGITSSTFVLPGTHAKWVTATDGVITGFRTYMTGEVYAALKDHTILGRLMTDGSPSGDGFTRGLDTAASARGTPGELLHLVFSTRSRGLFGEVAAPDLADYLSGLLIGAEIGDAAAGCKQVIVVASDALAQRYGTALARFGIEAIAAPADCVVAGLAAIARAGGWTGGGSSS